MNKFTDIFLNYLCRGQNSFKVQIVKMFLRFLVVYSLLCTIYCLQKRGIIGTNKCVADSNCKRREYCDKSLFNPLGECKPGIDDGSFCSRDHKCASKQCSFFRCKSMLLVRDGLCNQNEDCVDDQYCAHSIKVRKCVDKKCKGNCIHNQECQSSKCHLFTCLNIDNCEKQ
jgi:hypothetical protein